MAELMEEMSVLVVDDSLESQKIIRAMLQQIGIQRIFTASSGHEALTFLNMSEELGDKINIILCDWNMPKMTGLEVLKQIRSVDPLVPFIMVTGARDYVSITEAKAAGVSAYVGKPFSSEELEKKMKFAMRLLQRKDLHG